MVSKPSVMFAADEEKKAFILSQDIPGANLPRETVEECTVVQVKRWLVCRGAKKPPVKGCSSEQVRSQNQMFSCYLLFFWIRHTVKLDFI